MPAIASSLVFVIRAALVASTALALTLGCGGKSARGQADPGRAILEGCQAADDAAALVQVALRNDTGASLYVGPLTTPGLPNLFSVEDDNGNVLSGAMECGDVSCDARLRGRGQAADCRESVESGLRYFWVLGPGEQVSAFWNAERWVEYELPLDCLSDPLLKDASCRRAERLPLGSALTLRSSAGAALDCPSSACTECLPGGAGTCVVQASGFASAPLAASGRVVLSEASFNLTDVSQVVTLTFSR